MKPVAYHPRAASELMESARFYEEQREYLGEDFLAVIAEALVLMRRHPAIGRPEKCQTRSYKACRFPYRIFYREQADRLWIVAVAHLSRKPGYWHGRLKD